MKLVPRIYRIQNGQLKPKDQCAQPNMESEAQACRVIRYSYSSRPTPDQYHTQAIKQYKKQNDQLRKKYTDLQKAYYGLLGYCQDKIQRNTEKETPIHQLYKNGIMPTSAQINESTSKQQSSANISAFSIDQILMQSQDDAKKANRLSESILQEQSSIHEFRQLIIQEQSQKVSLIDSHLSQGGRNAKTQVDQDIQQLLVQAFKQIQQLRELLQEVKCTSSIQIQALRREYENKIHNLQQMLEKQRKQSRMLNSVINRMRQQLQSKQNFFKAVKQVRNGPQKNLIDRLLKQHRVSN